MKQRSCARPLIFVFITIAILLAPISTSDAGATAKKSKLGELEDPSTEIRGCYSAIRYWAQRAYNLIDCIIRRDLFDQYQNKCIKERREYKHAVAELKRICLSSE